MNKTLLLSAAVLALAGCVHLPAVIPSRDPLTADEHLVLGASYEKEGRLAEAEKQYQAAVTADKRSAEGWVALGDLAFRRGDWSKAEKLFKKALRAKPRHAGAENNLAMTYFAQDKKLAEAERLAQDALDQGGELAPYALDTLEEIRLKRRRDKHQVARGAP